MASGLKRPNAIFLLRESRILRDGSSAVTLPPASQTDICPAHFCALGMDVGCSSFGEHFGAWLLDACI